MTDAQALERLLAYRKDGWNIEVEMFPDSYSWEKFSVVAYKELGHRREWCGCGNTLAEAVEDLAGEIAGQEGE